MDDETTLVIKVPVEGTDSSAPPKPKEARPKGKGACLVVLTGDQAGRRIDLTASTRLGVGETVEVEQHSKAEPIADLTFDGDKLELRSLSVPAQTFVNDKPVIRADLKHGDRLRVDEQEMKVLISKDLEAMYQNESYWLGTHDPLTSAFNKRYLMENLERLTSRTRRWDEPLSVAVVRLGNLVEYEKKAGKQMSGLAMRRLADVLIELSRGDDIVARVAEEEFVVVLFHTNRNGAAIFTDRVRHIPTGGQLEIVVGVATLDATVPSAEILIEEARAQVNPFKPEVPEALPEPDEADASGENKEPAAQKKPED